MGSSFGIVWTHILCGPGKRFLARRASAPPAPREESAPPTDDATPKASADNSKLDSLRTRYIEMLVNKVETQEELDTELLNRIENLLGFTAGEEQ